MKPALLAWLYLDPLYLILAVGRVLLMLRYGHHAPDLIIAGLALAGLWRARMLARRKIAAGRYFEAGAGTAGG